MIKSLLKLLPKIGTIALLAYIGWLGWQNLGPRKPEIGAVRQELADDAITKIVEEIRTHRGDLHDVALLHFCNDSSDYFTNTLRSVIERQGTLELQDFTLMEKIRSPLNLRHPCYSSREEAIEAGQSLGVEGVLYGSLTAFESYPGGSKIEVEVDLVDVGSGMTVFTDTYRYESGSLNLGVIADVSQAFPWFKRLFGWAIAVLLLPVFTIGFIRATVRKESNRSNAFALGIYTVVDAMLAWLLIGGAIGSWFSVLVFVVAVAAACLYNIKIMAFAVRLEEV